MILPPTSVAAGSATTTTSSDTPHPTPTSFLPPYGSEQWNSLIGIITAIVGNILISFALNTQRYAHIRLEREWQEKERIRKRQSASSRSLSGSKHWRGSERTGEGADVDGDADTTSEENPLLPRTTPSRNDTGGSRPGLATVQEESDDGGGVAYKQKSYLKSPYWWAGIILMTCGEAGNFLAYGFAPASIVSPLGVVALVSNCIIAPFMLKEPFRKRDGLGVMVAVGGAVTVVASASDNNPKLGPGEIWDLISTWEFETYFGITLGIIIALMIVSNRFGEKSILIDLGLVGLFGGYTALSTKGVASLLSYTLWRAITFPVTYLLVAILVGTAVMQIKYLNRALQRFDATQVIPVQFVLFTLSVILGSAILYRDFERTSGEDAGKFVGGCAMTFLGVWLITSGRPPRNDDEEDRDPEPEDAINLTNGERYHDHVDGANGEDGESSRRSSTIRAASPPPIDTGRRPSTREIPQPATPDITFTPVSSSPTNQISGVPSPLTMNPWEQEASESPLQLSRPTELSRQSALSTPLLPSQSTDLLPASTSSPERSNGPPRPTTPIRQISDTAAVTPTAPSTLTPRLRRIATAERVSARNSIPGPLLASPLSNSLSAMVADLKRGGSIRSQRDGGIGASGDVRRRQSVLGIGASDVNEPMGEPLDRRRTTTDETTGQNEPQGGRGRSFSGTLGDLWRGWRALEGGDAGDVERGEGAESNEQS